MVFDTLISSMEQDDVTQIESPLRRGRIIKDVDLIDGEETIGIGDIITSDGRRYVIINIEKKRGSRLATLMMLHVRLYEADKVPGAIGDCFQTLYSGNMRDMLVDICEDFTNKLVGIPLYNKIYKYKEFIDYYYPSCVFVAFDKENDDFELVDSNGSLRDGHCRGHVICFAKIKIGHGD